MTHSALRTIGALLLALSSATAFAADAQPASEKSIREMIEVTGAGQLGMQMMQNMLPPLKKLVPQAPDSFWVNFMKEVNPEELTTLLIPIYQRHLSEKEIRDVIAFYKTPSGRKMIAAMPPIMQESMAAGSQWGQRLAQRALDKAKAEKLQ